MNKSGLQVYVRSCFFFQEVAILAQSLFLPVHTHTLDECTEKRRYPHVRSADYWQTALFRSRSVYWWIIRRSFGQCFIRSTALSVSILFTAVLWLLWISTVLLSILVKKYARSLKKAIAFDCFFYVFTQWIKFMKLRIAVNVYERNKLIVIL